MTLNIDISILIYLISFFVLAFVWKKYNPIKVEVHVGRKVFFFFLIFIPNLIAFFMSKFDEKFGYFCVFLYTVIVAGVEGKKIAKEISDNKKHTGDAS